MRKFCSISPTTTSSRSKIKNANKKTLYIGFFEIPLVFANLFFAILLVLGQVGQNISLPLWLDSVKNCTSTPSNNNTNLLLSQGTCLDSYFAFTFPCIWSVIFFGFALLVIKIFKPHWIGRTEKEFPNSILLVVGGCGCFCGLLVVYSSSGTRTAPYLQSILVNFLIPITVAVRFIILRKIPSIRKVTCAAAVVVSVFICLLPTIFPNLDPHAKKDLGGADGVAGILWPVCFMLGFTPVAISNVVQEKGLKMQSFSTTSTKGVNLIYFYFWTSLYQMLLAFALFWTDIIPGFGNVNNIDELIQKWRFGVRCFMGHAGCSPKTGIRGTMFISMYIVNLLGGGSLIRYSEGATYLAIVMALVTPLGFLFWTLFQEDPFRWHPQGRASTWFSLGGLALMIPAIFLYNTGPPENQLRRQEIAVSGDSTSRLDATERDPLINDS